ncbi:type VII secretion system-associated protein [Streptomyces sp. NEAU-W12]|uniref:type VII secretion system-associated protein n=1 Tax=Streptomyces sp. NEAU-W12 TaxID=2994668 RepID=UPI00224ABC26|nr:type VII secretion system-associated protein [Streptomyces sp. NEAU-W12]MCX2928369.1 type VII secretion system-associated protein [Streptomyces sp. NEAU-W12]
MSENTPGDRTAAEAEPDAVADEADDSAPEALDSQAAGLADDAPPIPDEIREAARLAPDHWLGMLDPTWTGEGEPPEWATVGRWRSSPEGEVVEWQQNPEYRPSPRALGWPEPEDDVDQAVQLAATGYGSGDAVPEALAHYEVAVLAAAGGGLVSVTTPEGTAAVPLYTSPVYLHTSGRFGFELMRVDGDLLDQVPDGHLLYLNPSGPVSMTLEISAVREALDGPVAAKDTDGRDRPVSADAPAPVPMVTTSSDIPVAPVAPGAPGGTDGAVADGSDTQGGAAQVQTALDGDAPPEPDA